MSNADAKEYRRALRMGLEIWDEYLKQIAHCVSQDYGRLNEFPQLCAKLGVTLDKLPRARKASLPSDGTGEKK